MSVADRKGARRRLRLKYGLEPQKTAVDSGLERGPKAKIAPKRK